MTTDLKRSIKESQRGGFVVENTSCSHKEPGFGGLQLSITPLTWESMHSSVLSRHQAYEWYTYIYMQEELTHTEN